MEGIEDRHPIIKLSGLRQLLPRIYLSLSRQAITYAAINAE